MLNVKATKTTVLHVSVVYFYYPIYVTQTALVHITRLRMAIVQHAAIIVFYAKTQLLTAQIVLSQVLSNLF